jgi:hypothetical protein
MGVVFSSGAFNPTGWQTAGPCSLEIWLQPASDDRTSTILTFSTRNNPEQFRLRQYIDGILIQRDPQDRQRPSSDAEIEIDHALHREQGAFVTVSSGEQGSAVYVDGIQVAKSPTFGLSSRDFAGQLVIGTSAVAADDAWSGELRIVAIYDQELTAAQIMRHYETWTDGTREIPEKEGAVALYLFQEGTGKIIHNQAASAPDLYIPESYEVLHKTLLESPWKEFRLNRAYAKDVLINTAGFVAFGFLFCANLSVSRRPRSAALMTVVLGGTISLAIEILQAYLPTRSSGMTDVITNTLGTGIGAILYSCQAVQALLAVKCESH